MALLCVKNGALVRNALKTELQLQSWTDFEELLENGEIGNKGFMGFYYDDIVRKEREIRQKKFQH